MNSKIIPTFLSMILIVFASVTSPSHALEIDDLERYLYPKAEKTISMNFTRATLENVLKIFSQQSGLNFIVTEEIAAESVNLYLVDVPVDEALELILSSHNLTYEINPGSNIFVVKRLQPLSQQLMTRVYHLKFATVPSSPLLSTLSASEDSTSSSEDSSEEDDETDGIVLAVESVLSDAGKVIEDSRSNSIIVTDIPSQFSLIESTIARLDIRVPQILIEAEILDINKILADDMGVKFGDTAIVAVSPAFRSTSYPFNPDPLIDDPDISFLKEYTTGTISFPALNMTLDFLRTHTDTKSLARPRILTLNNRTAEISIVTDEAIGLASNTTASQSSSTTIAQAERAETGISLRVTPQANVHTREITMAIEPTVTEVSAGRSFGGNSFRNPETRGTKSILRVKDGDTIVLGGLIRSEEDNIRTSIPFLGDIPVIGAPFRHKDKDAEERELIIFITPHILDEDVPMRTTYSKSQKIAREQSAPSGRDMEIEKDLLHMEKKYFNAYR